MKANELRIGNLLMGLMVYHVVSEIKEEYYASQYGSTLMRDANPIPISPEWFDKFSFEKEILNDHIFYSKGRLQYCVECELWWILGQKIDGWKGVKDPEFVHELQNLYYAIHGEELVAEPTRLLKPLAFV